MLHFFNGIVHGHFNYDDALLQFLMKLKSQQLLEDKIIECIKTMLASPGAMITKLSRVCLCFKSFECFGRASETHFVFSFDEKLSADV